MIRIWLIALVLLPSLLWGQQDLNNLGSAQLKDIQGTFVSAESVLSKDKAVILCTWATWSAYGQKNIKELSEYLQKKGKAESFVLVALNMDNSRGEGRVPAFVDAKGKDWLFNVYFDVDGSTSSKIGGLEEGQIWLFDEKGGLILKAKKADNQELKDSIKSID